METTTRGAGGATVREARIDAIVRQAVAADGPGAAVAVVRAGEVVHRAGYGLAHLEWGIALGTDTVLGLGSLTKPFTATAILLLEDEGALRLDDAVDAYLPGYAMHGERITLWHLLTHTSGIANYVTHPGFWEALAQRDLTADQLRAACEALPVEFAPGTRYRYSNSGYHLLGMIVERSRACRSRSSCASASSRRWGWMTRACWRTRQSCRGGRRAISRVRVAASSTCRISAGR